MSFYQFSVIIDIGIINDPLKEKIFCKLCNEQTNYIIDIFPRYHLNKVHNMSLQDYYDLCHKKEKEGICKMCTNPTTFDSLSRGYRIYCGQLCANKDPEFIIKRHETLSKRTPEKQAEINKKKLETNFSKFGTAHYSPQKSNLYTSHPPPNPHLINTTNN